MIGFQSDGIHQDFISIFLVKIVAQKHQYGANALATHRQDIADRFVKRLRSTLVGKCI